MGLTGRLRATLRSVLAVRLRACDMVSMLSSPFTEMLCSAEVGLPSGFLTGDMLSPLIDPEMLFGGDVSGP